MAPRRSDDSDESMFGLGMGPVHVVLVDSLMILCLCVGVWSCINISITIRETVYRSKHARRVPCF
jgi:hypothetical protein